LRTVIARADRQQIDLETRFINADGETQAVAMSNLKPV
jgi:hypothetical protein